MTASGASVTPAAGRARAHGAMLAYAFLVSTSFPVGAPAAAWVVFDGRLDRLLALDLGYGELLFLGGVLCFAAYSPAVKRLHRGESLLLVTFWVLVSGTLLLALYGAPRILATDWAAVPDGVFLGVAYLAVFNTAVTFYIAKYASLRLQGFKVMAYTKEQR